MMDKFAEYGVGCGITMIAAGIISFIGLSFGWGESSKEVYQLINILAEISGSKYLAAILFSTVGLVLVLVSSGIKAIQRKRRSQKRFSYPTNPTSWENHGDGPNQYMRYIQENLGRNQFEPFEFSPDHIAYKNSEFNLYREYYFVFKFTNQPLTAEKVKTYSQQVFNQVARKKRSYALFCYPVLITETVPSSVQKFIKSYKKKHLARFEFPVVVELPSRKLYYCGVSIWGITMYPELRKFATNMLQVPEFDNVNGE